MAHSINLSNYFSLRQVASLLQVHTQTVKAKADAGELPHFRHPINGRYYFPIQQIKAAYPEFFQLEKIG